MNIEKFAEGFKSVLICRYNPLLKQWITEFDCCEVLINGRTYALEGISDKMIESLNRYSRGISEGELVYMGKIWPVPKLELMEEK